MKIQKTVKIELDKDETAEEALRYGINVIGWYAFRSLDDSHWLGDDDGVVCYKYLDTARVSHAIISKQLGGVRSKYKIKPYDGENQVKGDNIIVFRTAEQVIAELEASNL